MADEFPVPAFVKGDPKPVDAIQQATEELLKSCGIP